MKGEMELVSLTFFFLAFEVGKVSVVWCVHVYSLCKEWVFMTVVPFEVPSKLNAAPLERKL